jgi:hypothetical protein
MLASYLEGSGFKSRPDNRLILTQAFHGFLQTFQTNAVILPQIKTLALPSTFFPSHQSYHFSHESW